MRIWVTIWVTVFVLISLFGNIIPNAAKHVFDFVLVGFVFVNMDRISLKKIGFGEWVFVGLCVILAASGFWAEIQEKSFVNAVAMFCFSLFSFFLLRNHSVDGFEDLLWRGITAGILGNFVFIVVSHDAGRQGGLCGVNVLGKFSALWIVLFLKRKFLDGRREPLYTHFIFFISMFLLVVSGSAGGYVYLFAGLLLIVIIYLRRCGLRGVSNLVIGAIIVLLYSGYTYFVGFLGRDLTFSGRTKIWSYAITSIGDKYLLGFGYKNFWSEDSQFGKWVEDELSHYVPNAHNGWLETMLAAGVIGLIPLVIAQFYAVRQTVWTRNENEKALYSLLLAFYFLDNLSSGFAIDVAYTNFVLFIVMCNGCSRRVSPLIVEG